ncbi:hypothetical protein LNI96_12030 [Tenacibaculum dicentrarchi]|nr:hypothetical protein [Tenacibaculum dicentrarchi]MCD8435946.1 hypothetical protein [Tenacibaculum dicentrarchi]WBX67874.1 hypothetical protein PG910_06980 [Tenacibaculum dicentrarchi]SOS48875.1 conserved hypothetical protein [Tenacibaculum dicentrarchi]
MNIYRLLFSTSLSLFFLSCNEKAIGEKPLVLENFKFETKITTLFPEKYKSKYSEKYYEIPSSFQTSLFNKDTIYEYDYIIDSIDINRYNKIKKPKWIEYHKNSYSTGDILAVFENFEFNTVNLATTLDNKIMVMNGLVHSLSKKETQNFIELLNKTYGKATITVVPFFKPYDIYTWTLEDRIIKYCFISDNESNTMKIIVDKENNTIENGKKNTHYKAYIYLIKKEYAKKIIGKMKIGDLSYCQ